MALSIKKYFRRHLSKDKSAKIVQYVIPYTMPVHMTSPKTETKTSFPLMKEPINLLGMINPNRSLPPAFPDYIRDQKVLDDNDTSLIIRKRSQEEAYATESEAVVKRRGTFTQPSSYATESEAISKQSFFASNITAILKGQYQDYLKVDD
jgi:hypothetical protein